MNADDVIKSLELQPLPMEGGYFRETYRCARHIGGKSLATAIYYLITPSSFSRLHRLPTDELFHFYLGDPVEQLQLFADGTGRQITLGTDIHFGQQPQVKVPAGVWQGSRLRPGGRFALLGTTMSPGFDPADFEPGMPEQLIRSHPEWQSQIQQLASCANLISVS